MTVNSGDLAPATLIETFVPIAGHAPPTCIYTRGNTCQRFVMLRRAPALVKSRFTSAYVRLNASPPPPLPFRGRNEPPIE